MTLGNMGRGVSITDAVRSIASIPNDVVVQVRSVLPNIARSAEALVFPHNAELKRKAFTHPLTDMPNEEAIASHVQEKFGENSEVFVFYIDSDGLKNINDTHGHPVGDEYLKSIADRLKDIDGLAFHLHGDEFFIVLDVKRAIAQDDRRGEEHVTDPEGFAERVVNFVRESVEHTASISGVDGLIEVPVEISIGYVSCIDSRGETIVLAKDLADQAMYRDKVLRQAKKVQQAQDAELSRATGKTEFLEVHDLNTSAGERIRELTKKLVTDVGHLDSLYSAESGKNIPRFAFTELIEELNELGCESAARYVAGLSLGSPIYSEDDLVVGSTGQTVSQWREVSHNFNR